MLASSYKKKHPLHPVFLILFGPFSYLSAAWRFHLLRKFNYMTTGFNINNFFFKKSVRNLPSDILYIYSLKKFTNQQQVNFHVNIILHATNSTQLTPVSKIIKMFNASATDVFTQRHFLTSASIISSRIKHIPATRSDRWAAGFTCQVCYFTRRLVESRNTILFSIYLNI